MIKAQPAEISPLGGVITGLLASKVLAVTADWASWVNQQLTRKGWRPADAARAFGVDDSMISKWRRGLAGPDPKSLRRVAESLELPILEVLVAAGWITPEEAGQPPAPPASEAVELLKDIQQKIKGQLDQMDPPPPGRNPHPSRRASDVPDTVFSNADVDQTEQPDYSNRVQ
jgi:transcriptional regulator with XRE-family HTH domain